MLKSSKLSDFANVEATMCIMFAIIVVVRDVDEEKEKKR